MNRCACAVLAVSAFVSAFAAEPEPQWISDTNDKRWTGEVEKQPKLPKNTIRMRRTFKLANRPVRKAVAEMCGYGFSEFWVNGEPADPRRRLSPAVCNYWQQSLSAAYDVTALLRPGDDNTIGLWISPGYSDDFSKYGWRWLLPKRAWGRLDVTFADGTRQTVVTDGSWEWTDLTPIGAVSVYDGECYDAAREDAGWCRPSGSVAAWKPVVCVKPRKAPRDGRDIVPQKNPAPFIRTLETFRPVGIRETDPGVWTVDFGQNMAGVCELRAKGKAGTCIALRHSETIRRDGSGRLDPFPQRAAKAIDRFVLAGTGEWERYIPHFTYHGFRYVEVRGYPGRLTAEDICARAIHADVKYTAGFTSSDETLNWLFEAAKWTLLSNLLNYPSDCCDRDERTPCRGDSRNSEPSSMRFFGMDGLYSKWLEDIKYDGPAVPCTTGDLVMLPWRFWELYGDMSQMKRHYGDMKRVVLGFIDKHGGYIVEEGGYGDWCHPNNKKWEDYFCEPRALCSAIIYKLLTTMRDVAELLDKKEDVPMWEEHAAKSKAAYLAKIYDPRTHVFSRGLQANYVLPLAFGLVPEKDRPAVVGNLVDRIRQDGMKLSTGGVVSRFLVNVLCAEGHADIAYHLLTQPEYPSPAYMRAQGATTLWEQWYYEEAMNSHSHMMFTGLGSTLLTDFAGIRPKKPGYAELEIRPACPRKLSFVDAWQETRHGRVEVSWKRDAQGIGFSVTVPPGVPATLVLPDGTSHEMKSGRNTVRFDEDRKADVPQETVRPPSVCASGAKFPTLDVAYSRCLLVTGEVSRFEAKLDKLRRGEAVTLVVVGGSITEGAGASRPELRWGNQVADAVRRAYPRAKVRYVNAGVGATGSDIAVFRAKDDVLRHRPDFVFVEFSVNDGNDLARAETMEGLVRQLLADENDIAVLMLGMVSKGGGNAQEWHAKVARHYGVPYLSYRNAIYPGVADGTYKWTDISPDTIHPNDAGHTWAAALVSRFMTETARRSPRSKPDALAGKRLPRPLLTADYDRCRFVRMGDVKPVENVGFVPYEENHWGRGLQATNAGSRLVFEFEGATAKLLYPLGKRPFGRAKVSVDGEVVAPAVEGFRDQWWWFTPVLDLVRNRPGRHRVEIVTLDSKDPASAGFGFGLCVLMIADKGGWEQPMAADPKLGESAAFDPVAELLHLERLPLEKTGCSIRYEGSIDRQGLNNDGAWMMYQAATNEWVVFEHLGPGSIMNFTKHGWIDARGDVTFRFYFDGEAVPRFVILPSEFGQKTPFLSPLADVYMAPTTRGPGGAGFDGIRIARSFLPMPFAKSCRITSSVNLEGEGWGHVLCQCYSDNRQVKTFDPYDPAYLVARRKLMQCGRNPHELKAATTSVASFDLRQGDARLVFSSGDAGLVAGLRIDTRDFFREDLTNLWVRAWWNGAKEADLDVPFGSLFSNELGYSRISTLLSGCGVDGSYYNYLPMPFTRGARIEVVNRGARSVRFDRCAITSTREYDGLYATGRYGVLRGAYYPPTRTKVGHDTVFARIKGRGHVVSSVLTGRHSFPICPEFKDKTWHIWEGDARIHLDGLRTPQVESDGSESYASYGWGFWEPPQCNPFSAYDCIRGQDWCMTRHLMTDCYPFDGGCRFGFEAGGENRFPMVHSGSVFWYAYGGGEWRELKVVRQPAAGEEVSLTSVFEGEVAFGAPETRRGRYAVPAELSFEVPQGTEAVVVRRVSDQAKARQLAAVYVNGREIGGRPWYVPDSNPWHRWLEDDYRIPASDLKTGLANTVRIVPRPCGGGVHFNDFGYQVFAVVGEPDAR